ncbi:MAG: glycosyltransferase family 2 protein [Candidatus Uhrbacteria bacterium]
MKPKVAIIYLSYNARPYIDDVVLSLEQQTYSSDRLKLIIVDNPGQDDSLDYIQKQIMPRSGKGLPEIELIANQKNTGFAIGNNQGIKSALDQGYDYVYLLNNDAKLDPEAIERAVEVAEADLKIGSVQSLMLLWQNPEVINSTGGMVHFLGFGFVRDNGAGRYKAQGTRVKGNEIAYASGAAVLYRADLLRKIGLLDEFLWLYHEDLELGWRIRLAGYKNVLAEKSIAYHHYEFSRSIEKWFWMERNRWIVLLTHLRWGSIILLAPALLFTELAIYIASIRSGWIREKFLSCVDLLRPATLKNIVAKRRVSQEFRKVSDREIVRLFTAKIEHQETSGPILKYLINPAMSLVWYVIRFLIRW